MRFIVFSAMTIALSTTAVAAPAVRPQLASEPLFSASQLADVRPSGSAQDFALYEAVQSLIERYGITGISYTDNTVRKDLMITAGEAKVVLISAYERLALLANASVESEVSKATNDDDSKIISRFKVATDRALNPAGSCQLLVGTKFAAKPKKGKAKAQANSATVTWNQALACLPGANVMPLNPEAYNLKAALPAAAITRGEFLHKLNEAADNSVNELSMAAS